MSWSCNGSWWTYSGDDSGGLLYRHARELGYLTPGEARALMSLPLQVASRRAVTIMTGHVVKLHSDGWELADVTRPGDQEVRFELRGLRVTRSQASWLARQRHLRTTRREPRAVELSLEVTWPEAHAIWHQERDPLAVLIPLVRVRRLSLEELLAR